jgi:signal transduction histidine kinase
MSEMIGTLLDFTQLRSRGGLPLSKEPVELGVVARAVVDELRAAHPGRGICIDAKSELRGQWDAGRIAQVVSNLAGNALVHGAGEWPVELVLASEESHVVMRVTNRGPTIPDALVDRLFEPFQQGPDPANAPRSRGLGLGLFIVREIVHAHGGTIEVRSRDDVTAFTVRLPRVATS